MIRKQAAIVFKVCRWILWELSGLHFIWHQFNPAERKNEKKPVTAGLWIVGTYTALFGIASQVYEMKISIIENRITSITSALSTPTYRNALNRIWITENIVCPIMPEILNPIKTLASLFGPQKLYQPGIELLKGVIEDWKYSLNHIRLSSIHLNYASLDNALLDSASLIGSKITGTDLSNAHFKGADLGMAILNENSCFNSIFVDARLIHSKITRGYYHGADFSNANLRDSRISSASFDSANLSDAILRRDTIDNVNFSHANFSEADLRGAIFSTVSFYKAHFNNSDLTNARFISCRGLTSQQLCAAKSLRGVQLPQELKKEVCDSCENKLTVVVGQKKWPHDEDRTESTALLKQHGLKD